MRRYVEEALAHANGELSAEDIYNYLMAERMFLFVAHKPEICGAATCEVVQYTRKKAIRVVTLGGNDFVSWREPLHNALKEWAGRIKADGIEAYVRKGLVPQLEDLGFKQIYVGMWHGQEAGHAND